MTDGRSIYRVACVRCHGELGKGGPPVTPTGPRPRDFTDPAWQTSRSDVEIKTAIRQGKGSMPPFSAVLTPTQIDTVASYVRQLGRAGPAVGPAASGGTEP